MIQFTRKYLLSHTCVNKTFFLSFENVENSFHNSGTITSRLAQLHQQQGDHQKALQLWLSLFDETKISSGSERSVYQTSNIDKSFIIFDAENFEGKRVGFYEQLCAFCEGVVPLVGNGYLFHTASYFSIGSVMVALTFGWCRKSKTVKCLLSGFSFLKRDVWMSQLETARPKITKRCFFYTLQKLGTQKIFSFGHSFLCQWNRTWTPKILYLGWDELGSTWDFPKAKHDSYKPWIKTMLGFFVRYLKTLFQNFRWNRFGSTTRKFFFRDKNPGRLHVTIFVFLQRSKNSSNIEIAIENMKNAVP